MNCIKCTTDENKSWCGRELDKTFYFKDTEQAVINGIHGETVPCFECITLVVDYLTRKVNYENLD